MTRGFDIHTLAGRRGVLARTDLRAGPRVGRYRVCLGTLEAVAVPSIAPGPRIRLVVIDEIGKMECLSAAFCDAVRAALDSVCPVLATVARSGGGFIAEVRRRSDVTLVPLTAANRDGIPARVRAALGL